MSIEDLEIHEILPDILLKHALKISSRYDHDPEYAARYILELLKNSDYKTSREPQILEVKKIIKKLVLKVNKRKFEKQEIMENDNQISLREEISEYYLRHQLVEAILDKGEIPRDSVETWIGVGFIDIANYSYLSKWLSPKENQVVLNGLYSALNMVLHKYKGYLNKMEGDSLMFHYGGTIDPQTKGKNKDEVLAYISKELFYTCIEMQKTCVLFNNADDRFLSVGTDVETRRSLNEAFHIIKNLRENMMFASVINALFQIQIRIGANIGEVSIGNFGPSGAKQWDIIGVPVIEAKRMETTAPVGGLRISEHLYNQLEASGIVNQYLKSFREEAKKVNGYYQDIKKKQLFKFSKVQLSEKRNVTFNTYSIQVNPALPEDICRKINILLQMDNEGADQIIETLQYYRGNKHVMRAAEQVFIDHGIYLRKDLLLRTIGKKNYSHLEQEHNEGIQDYINQRFSLYDLMTLIGRYQDKLKTLEKPIEDNINFVDLEQFISEKGNKIDEKHDMKRQFMSQRNYFYNKIFPMVFAVIKASVLDYQHSVEDVEPLEEL